MAETKLANHKATKFGLVVSGLSSIHVVLGSILISNIVNKKKWPS
jgi:hypothetical protein